MDVERWKRARALFDAIIDTPSAGWSEALMKACPDDSGLRLEVLALLEADDAQRSVSTMFVNRVPDLVDEFLTRADAKNVDAWIGRRLGVWRLTQPIGQGGMGMVYLAERDDGEFVQQAAIKIMRAGADSHVVMQRFRVERQILARLDHPNIAHVLDGGISEEGIPWFALEYIDGVSLLAWCDAKKLSIRQRLILFLSVCSAVSYAHARLVVHRDLKPANILVDSGGHAKLLDFGIAKILDEDGAIAQTGTLLRMLTPEYAAPEQLRGETVTTSVDIYALGMILFEMLTGAYPYKGPITSVTVISNAVLTQDPMRASTAFTQRDFMSGSRSNRETAERKLTAYGCPPKRVRKQLRGDLDAILSKALRKEPSRRYQTVAELGADIRAYLDLKPVSARLGNRRYRIERFIRRHTTGVIATTLAVLALVAGLGASLRFAQVAENERAMAQDEAKKAEAIGDFLRNLFVSTDPANTDGHDPRASELLEKGASDLALRVDLDGESRSAMLAEISNAFLSLDQYERALEYAEKANEAAVTSGNPRSRIEALVQLGSVLNQLRRLAEALAYFEEARRLYDSEGISDPMLSSEIDSSAAIVLNNLGRRREALAHLRSAFGPELSGSALAPGQHQMLQLYAVLLAEAGQANEAVAIMESAHASLSNRPDFSLLDRSNVSAALGHAYLRADRPADAEMLFREALDLRERIYGKDHISTATSLNNVSIALRDQGKYVEAADYALRCLEVNKQNLPPSNERIASASIAAGIVFAAAGKFEEAIALLDAGMQTPDWIAHSPSRAVANGYMALIDALEALGQGDRVAQVIDEILQFIRDGKVELQDPVTYPLRLRVASAQSRLQGKISPAMCEVIRTLAETSGIDESQRQAARELLGQCDAPGGQPAAAGAVPAAVLPPI